MNVTQLAR